MKYYVSIPGQPDSVIYGPNELDTVERWASTHALTSRMRLSVHRMNDGALVSVFDSDGKRIEAP